MDKRNRVRFVLMDRAQLLAVRQRHTPMNRWCWHRVPAPAPSDQYGLINILCDRVDKRSLLQYHRLMKAQVIFNPAAGQRDARSDLGQAIAYLESQGWEISLKETLGRGDATTNAREAMAMECDAVLVASGDGTLGEAIKGLLGTDVALGVLPVGLTNVWARQMGLPVWSPISRHRLVESAIAMSQSHIRRIDVGRVDGRCFIYCAGVGFDARVTELVESHQPAKRRLGHLVYAIAAIVEVLAFVGTKAAITVDGETLRARVLLVIASNAQIYSGFVRVAPNARLDDGWLDVCVFRGQGTWAMLSHVIRLLTGKHMQGPKMVYYRARRIEIETVSPMAVHADGDPAGYTPVTIEIIPRALNVLVPPSAPEELFTKRASL